jgi:hypothetical protein
MRKKLHKELKRAKERLHRVEDSAGFDKERERQDFLASKGKRSRHMSEVIRTRQRAVDRRRLVLAEFERLANGGSTDKPLLTAKGSTKLQERMGRTVAGAARKPLGKVASSFKLVVKGGRLVYGSEIKWSAALNDGAVVGHGAVIQPYEFCKLEEIDVEVLVAALMAEGVNVISH